MCIACRERHPASDLLRFRRRSDGHVVPVADSSDAVGRSAYLCPSHSCYQTAVKRRAFTRMLAGPKGLSVAAPGSTLWVDAERAVTRQVEQLRRSGAPSGASGRLNQLTKLQLKLQSQGGAHKGVRHGQGSSL